jgi:hypothetical protein
MGLFQEDCGEIQGNQCDSGVGTWRGLMAGLVVKKCAEALLKKHPPNNQRK